jgi:hypothetical protein
MLITVLLIAAIVLCGLFMAFAIFKAVTGPRSLKKDDDDGKYGGGDPYDYSDPDSTALRDD